MFNVSQLIEEMKNGNIQIPEYSFLGGTDKYSPYINLIREGKYGEYILELDKIELDKYLGNHMDRLTFLVSLVNALKDSPDNAFKERAVNLTISKWQSPQDDDPSGVIGDLINSILCPLDAIQALLVYYDDITANEIIESQITQESGLSLDLLLNRVITLFKERTSNRNVITSQELNYLRSIAETYNNKSVLNWIDSKLKNELSIAEKPHWVNIQPGETADVLIMDLWRAVDKNLNPIPSMTSDAIVDFMKDNYTFTKKGEVIDDREIVEVADTALKSSVFSSMVNSAFNSEVKYPADPDRMFGPINKRIEGRCVSSILFDCFMLSCRCRDFDQSDDAEPTDIDPEGWFKGECDACSRKILDISYSLRYPVINGGFIGCFCSSDCLKIKPSRTPTQMTELILDNMFAVIEEKGIIDRLALAEGEDEGDNEGDEGDDEDEEIHTFYAKSQIKNPQENSFSGII